MIAFTVVGLFGGFLLGGAVVYFLLRFTPLGDRGSGVYTVETKKGLYDLVGAIGVGAGIWPVATMHTGEIDGGPSGEDTRVLRFLYANGVVLNWTAKYVRERMGDPTGAPSFLSKTPLETVEKVLGILSRKGYEVGVVSGAEVEFSRGLVFASMKGLLRDGALIFRRHAVVLAKDKDLPTPVGFTDEDKERFLRAA